MFVAIPKYYPADEAKMAGYDAAMAAFRKMLFVPANISMVASKRTVNGTIPMEGSTLQPWRDDSAVYGFFPTVEYVVQRGEFGLSKVVMQGDAGVQVPSVQGIRALEGLYPYEAIKFYNRRVLGGDKSFERIPGLRHISMPSEQAGMLNLGDPQGPVTVEWPLAIFTGDANTPTTINPWVALRFSPSADNLVEAFDVREYDKAFPLEAAGAVATRSNEQIANAARGILADPRFTSDDARGAAIKFAVTGKR